MRTIDKIIVHCTATKADRDFHAADIDRWHKEKGWQGIGYHFVVCLDGTIEIGRKIDKAGAHCEGQNKNSIGVVYVGGLDAKGRAADTRNIEQKHALLQLLTDLVEHFHCPIFGHRDFARKDCPCFDAHKEYSFILNNWLKRQALGVYEIFPDDLNPPSSLSV